ncbi:MAG: hypothetical protein U5M72_12040 [Pseudomonas sp.]|nr:hypothetical protein [Pseudomonas sp.]
MNLDDLAINYYHDSLALAQKALISGITVSGIAYLIAITGIGKSSYSIPFIGIEVESLSYFSISLLFLYFACGMLCLHGMQKALNNWQLISDIELSARLLQVPNILMAGTISKALLYGGLFSVGASLSAQIFNINDWKIYLAGSLVGLPYFLALRTSSYFEKPAPRENTDNPN